MKIYKIIGNKNCSQCENQAEFYCDTLDFCLCKKCAVELYRAMGEHLVPRAIPNVILRSEKFRQNGEKYLGVTENCASSNTENSVGNTTSNRRKTTDRIEVVKKAEKGTIRLQNTGKMSRNERRNKWQILKKKSLPEFTKNSKD